MGFVAVLFGAAAGLFAAYGGMASHLSASDCGSCHLAGTTVRAGQASKLVASQEALCETCHKNVVKVSHPSGFPPRRPLPPEYPLDWKGDLTCSTCHVTHGAGPGLLRGDKRGKAFCLACHTAGFFDNMKDAGSSIMISGHMTARGDSLSLVELDSYSLECLGCHLKSGSIPGVSINGIAILRHDSGGANHPVGRKYSESAKFGGYRPEQSLSKKIFLPNGKLSCLSCHQGYSQAHGKLVFSNSRSALCFECHLK